MMPGPDNGFNIHRPAPFDPGEIVRCTYPTTGLALGADYIVRAKWVDRWCFMPVPMVRVAAVDGTVIDGVFATRFDRLPRPHRAAEPHPRPFAGKGDE